MPTADVLAKCAPWRRRFVIALMTASLTAAPSMALAAQNNPDLCRAAARAASAETGVPYDVLMAIALTETGRTRDGVLEPWPWAVQYDGQGDWFGTKAEAIATAETALRAGATNIDLGCFQLNIRWHAGAFESVEDMLSPDRNARYAADFLLDLYQESGDWSKAAGVYHSRTPEKAQTYRARYDVVLAGLRDGSPAASTSVDPELTPRDNRFPLLQAGAPGGIGSLVPLMDASTPMFAAGARLVGG